MIFSAPLPHNLAYAGVRPSGCPRQDPAYPDASMKRKHGRRPSGWLGLARRRGRNRNDSPCSVWRSRLVRIGVKAARDLSLSVRRRDFIKLPDLRLRSDRRIGGRLKSAPCGGRCRSGSSVLFLSSTSQIAPSVGNGHADRRADADGCRSILYHSRDQFAYSAAAGTCLQPSVRNTCVERLTAQLDTISDRRRTDRPDRPLSLTS